MIPKLKQPLCRKYLANREEMLTADQHKVAQISMLDDANGILQPSSLMATSNRQPQ
jgi:hypothetical protein